MKMKFSVILNEDTINESKADEEKLINFAGEELAKRFFSIKNRVKPPYNDLYYWIKNGSVNELQSFVSDIESTQTRKQKDDKAKEGAELIYSDDVWDVYHITTYEASAKYGKNTQWCITGSKRWSNGERGEEYFNSYTSRGIKFCFYINKKENKKYALALYPDGENYEIFDETDHNIDGIADAPTIDGLPNVNVEEFEVEDGVLLGYHGNGGNVVIPDNVNRIGNSAFQGCTGLTSITIPNSVTSIGSSAFQGCRYLESVIIPDSVKSIGSSAFLGCKYLASVTIGDGVTDIGNKAFYRCMVLTSITIPDNVTNIGDWAFEDCTGLTSVAIGNSVERIGDGVFYSCTRLTSVNIPNSVTSIGNLAFSSCFGLKSVTIGDGVKSIGNWAFSDCTGLTSITIPNSVESIGSGAFMDCTGLTSVTLGNSVKRIGDDAFYGCKNLTVFCEKDSYAEQYCKENNIRYSIKEDYMIESSGKKLLNEDIDDMKKYYPNIPDKDFMSYIELDPTYNRGSNKAGTYAKWILALANKGQLDNAGHVKDILTRFNDNKKNLKEKDISKFKSIDDLEDMLNNEDSYIEQSHRQEVRQRQKDRKSSDLQKDATLVYEDSDWEVWVPHTYSASCKLGQGTRWCTASTENDYYYYYYQSAYGGDYYIVISKSNPSEKYQFHFESDQYMNAEDSSIDLMYFLDKNEGLKGFFMPRIKSKLDELLSYFGLSFDSEGESYVSVDKRSMVEYLCDRNRSMGSFEEEFILNLLRGDGPEEFYNDYPLQEYDVKGITPYIDTENMKKLRKIGVPDDLDDIDDDLEVTIIRAYADSVSYASAKEAERDLIKAIEKAIPEYVISVNFGDEGEEDVFFRIDDKKMVNELIKYKSLIKDAIDGYSSDIEIREGDPDYNKAEFILFHLSDYINFNEPRYGWNEFDESIFNKYLSDALDEYMSENNISEKLVESESQDWREYFTDKTTGVSYYDDFLDHSEEEYLKKNKNRVGEVVMMSPKEYLQRVATMFDSSYYKQYMIASEESSQEEFEKIIDRGEKLWMPYISEKDVAQEGRHRAYFAMRKGISEIPVLVISVYDKEIERECENKEVERKVYSAIKYALDYKYNSIEDFKQELQWILSEHFDLDVDIDISEISNEKYAVKTMGVEVPFDKNDLVIRENSIDFDDIDFDDDEL